MKNYCMPDPGEGLTEGEVVSWRVSPGDTVKINDVLCEVETAKSIVELDLAEMTGSIVGSVFSDTVVFCLFIRPGHSRPL